MTTPTGSRYVSGEARPVEVLVFEVDPDHLDEFLVIDHEVWTLGEADFLDHIPFLSKEVWVTAPGTVTIVFVWEERAGWDAVDVPELQNALTAEFDRRFPHDYRLVDAPHERSDITRWSRFER